MQANDYTILVVDDEELLRKAIAYDFKKRGYNTLEAENGSVALEIVKGNKIDLIISDIQMPNGNGVELLKNVKLLNPNTPVLMFITGFADLTNEEAFALGADAIFSKPFNRKTLQEAVERSLKPRSLRWSFVDGVDTSHCPAIELQFENFDSAIKTKLINIGRGGFFAALNSSFPELHSVITFKILMSQDPNHNIEGKGIVRWVRETSKDSLPTGCGVEFTFLEDNSLKKIVDFLEKHNISPFIPKN